jgi:hypothetical protein
MANELRGYPDKDISEALDSCARELTGKLSLAAILERLNHGHPGVEQAWAACLPARDEWRTIVWTEEMATAFGAAKPLLDQGDVIAARMAFKEVYTTLMREVRRRHVPAKWFPSLGHDVEDRRYALLAAQEQGKLKGEHVKGLLSTGAPELLDLWKPKRLT